MYPIKLTVKVEPADPYEKARQDVYEVLHSLSVLTPMQREMLAKELFGVANITTAVQLMHMLYGEVNPKFDTERGITMR